MRSKSLKMLILAGAVILITAQGCATERFEDVAVPEGTALAVVLDDPLSSDGSRRGERFEAILLEPVMVDATVVIAAGSRVRGKLLEVRPASAAPDGGAALTLVVDGIELANGEMHSLATEPVRCVPQANAVAEAGGIVVALATVRGELALRPGLQLRFETTESTVLPVARTPKVRGDDV